MQWRRGGAGLRVLALAAALGVLCSMPGTRVEAQSTEFQLSIGSVVFPTPTPGNYTSWPPSASGPVTDSMAVPFTVDRVSNNTIRVTTVLIRCLSVSGPKACGDYEWRAGATGPWQPLTLVDTEVESRLVFPFFFNDPWSSTVWLRVRLNASDPAPSVVMSNIALTLSVTRL
jgi:hypothetical protein